MKLLKPATFGLDAKIKDFFFDRKLLNGIITEKTRKALGRIGGSIRLTAIRSMKRPGKRLIKATGDQYPPSQPGKPPNAHAPSGAFASLKNIIYAFNPDNQGVVIGPRKANMRQVSNGFLVKGTVPAVHEFGGIVGIREKVISYSENGNRVQKWIPVGRKRPKAGQGTRVRQAQYPKRPFMQPALEKYIPKIPDEFKGIVSTQ